MLNSVLKLNKVILRKQLEKGYLITTTKYSIIQKAKGEGMKNLTPNTANESTTVFDSFPCTAIYYEIQYPVFGKDIFHKKRRNQQKRTDFQKQETKQVSKDNVFK